MSALVEMIGVASLFPPAPHARLAPEPYVAKPADPVEMILVINNVAGMWRRKTESK